MKKAIIFITLSAMLLLTVFSGFTPQQQQVYPIAVQQDQPQKALEDLFQHGIITIKVKEHVGEITKQSGVVTFNIYSLDQLATTFEVNQLDKRFKYNPAKLRADLPDLSRIYKLSFPENINVQQVAEAFNIDPNIEYAEPIPIDRVDVVPDDALYGQCQHLPQVMAEEAWEIHKGEDGTEEVVVAIVDTGVDWNHEDLSDNSWQNMGEDADGDGVTLEYNGSEWILDPDDLNGIDDDNNGFVDDLIGWDFYDFSLNGDGTNPDPYPPNPVHYHGTHVGGIAAGCTDNAVGTASLSWNVKYMAVQCASNINSVSWGYDGIIYAAEMEADIINNSWGGPASSQAAADIIEYATGLGSIIVCSAGNDYDRILHYPSGYPGVLSVASVSQNDVKSGYSNFGHGVDISAPGGGWEGGILSPVPNDLYEYKGGTSMASPMVASLMALVKSYHPEWTKDEVMAQVIYTADNIDTINPDQALLLGHGRINAYQALAMENVSIPQELELEVQAYSLLDNDNNKIIEPGDTVTANFVFRNYNQFVGDTDVNFTLTSEDADIQFITSSFQSDVEPDGTVYIQDVMKFVIAEEATNHISSVTFSIEANLPVIGGNEIIIEFALAPSGILVYDAMDKPRDMSGKYIASFLEKAGQEVTYVTELPFKLIGYETVFSCFGNVGVNIDQGSFNNRDLHILREYLIYGGYLYLESGSFFTGLTFGYPDFLASMKSFFGVGSFNSSWYVHQLEGMQGIDGTLMENIHFSISNQLYNFGIEALTPNNTGECSFIENNIANVAVHKEGTSHKAFHLGYTLAELEDVDPTSSRYNVIMRLLDFFEADIPDDYLIANFKAENKVGSAPLEVSFNDLSLKDEDVAITSWAWDFDSDGQIDSNEENPVYTYENPGHYDVTLFVSSEDDTDTLVQKEYVQVNHGVLVFEKREGQRNFSGTFIYDFLIENGIEAHYTSTYPTSFIGYDAVFISQGISSYLNSTMPDGIVQPLVNFMQSGGHVYLEGGDALGGDLAAVPDLLPYFGLETISSGQYNPLDNLTGMQGSIAEGMEFDYSNQTIYGYQYSYTLLEGAQTAFLEGGTEGVAVQSGGPQYKTFYFSYTLAELEDNETTTREELLEAILEYFGILISGQEEFAVEENNLFIYPNPCSGAAHLRITNKEQGITIFEVFTISGKKIKELMNEEMLPGTYDIEVNLSDLPAGIYYCVLKSNAEMQVVKIIKL